MAELKGQAVPEAAWTQSQVRARAGLLRKACPGSLSLAIVHACLPNQSSNCKFDLHVELVLCFIALVMLAHAGIACRG